MGDTTSKADSAGAGDNGWQVGAGTTAAQTAQVSVGNAGSGALGWTAASDQPWLFALDLPMELPPDTQRGRDMSLMRRRPVTELLRYRVRGMWNRLRGR